MIVQPKSLAGNPTIDKPLMDLWEALSNVNSNVSTSTTTVNTNSIITDLGATAYKVTNRSGILLPSGYIVQMYSDGITIAAESSRSACAVIYKAIQPYSTGYVVTNGLCMVYFNSAGCNYGEFFRMSYNNDTINDDAGLANSLPIQGADALTLLGYTLSERTGEGLSKCLKTR